MTATDALGWGSSAVLLATISKQVYRQWSAGTSEGVSKWLFLGQVAASVGFTIYSALVGNPVVIATNGLMVVAACAGLTILFWHRRSARRRESGPPRARGRRSCRSRLTTFGMRAGSRTGVSLRHARGALRRGRTRSPTLS